MENSAGNLSVGQSVNVDAHGKHDEDFSGVIVGINGIDSIAHVKAPDGEIYDCDLAFVYSKPPISTPTPGPWRPFFRYVLANGRFLATAHAIGDKAQGVGFKEDQEPIQDASEAEANARLMAAALDFKSGAEKAVEWLDLIKQNYPEMVSLIEGLTELRNAIAKSGEGAN